MFPPNPNPDPTEQYSTTKTNWLADYCKEEDVCAAQSLASVSWMGSSVDPPSFGQSEYQASGSWNLKPCGDVITGPSHKLSLVKKRYGTVLV